MTYKFDIREYFMYNVDCKFYLHEKPHKGKGFVSNSFR